MINIRAFGHISFLLILGIPDCVYVRGIQSSDNIVVQTRCNNDVISSDDTFFCVDNDGIECVVKSGKLSVDMGGNVGLIVRKRFYPFRPQLVAPPDAESIDVDIVGEISVRLQGDDVLHRIGSIECQRFNAGFQPPDLFEARGCERFPYGKSSFVIRGYKLKKQKL